MYWQQRFDRQNSDAELEAKIKALRQSDKDFGYRRIWVRAASTVPTKVLLGVLLPIGCVAASIYVFHIKKSPQIPLNLSIMKWTPTGIFLYARHI